MTSALTAHDSGIDTREIVSRRIDARPACKLPWPAFAIALALHAALALLFCFSLRAAEADEDGGASVIEVEFETAAPKTEKADATPGPQSEASAAAPDSTERRVETATAEKPKEDPALVENERETPETALMPSVASTASIAAPDSAPPVVLAALEAPVARAPDAGLGQSMQRESAAWRKKLAAHLARHKSYPVGARRDAEVAVRFRLERNGRIALAEIARKSGLPAFDDAALAMLKHADPAPAPPAHIADDALTFTVPIVFRIRDR